jgi:hypothetical protein
MMHDRGATKTASTDDALAEATLAGANDIERASAALRSVQPDLEIWRDGAAMPRRSRHSPAWLAIGVVWVSTLVFIGLAAAGVTILVR